MNVVCSTTTDDNKIEFMKIYQIQFITSSRTAFRNVSSPKISTYFLHIVVMFRRTCVRSANQQKKREYIPYYLAMTPAEVR